MSAVRLSTRYAKSLLELAQEKNVLEEVKRDIETLQWISKKNRDFAVMMHSPVINADKKQHVFSALFKDRFNNITMTFLDLVAAKRREMYLPEITNEFLIQYNQLKNITPVKATTAVPIDEAMIKTIEDLLKQKAGIENIQLTSKVDPNLIGGFKLEYGDKLYDASIRHKLDLVEINFEDNPFIRKQ
jgi:F-type H+-transporting ATPase subunit delta